MVQALYRNFEWSLKNLLFRSVCIFADNIPIAAGCRLLFRQFFFEHMYVKWIENDKSGESDANNSACAHTHINYYVTTLEIRIHTNLPSVIRT